MIDENIEEWLEKNFREGVNPPFSFKYNKKMSSKLLPTWKFSKNESKIDDDRIKYNFIYLDPKTSLEVVCQCIYYKSESAIEVMLILTNKSNEKTPIIQDIEAFDGKITQNQNLPFILHTLCGSDAKINDFEPRSIMFKTNNKIKFAPKNGRSSNTTAFPFFNLEATGFGGLFISIGWSGQWAATFVQENNNNVDLKCGMELTRLSLLPNESIRTPKVLFMKWVGKDRMIGHNQFRQFILRFYTPRKNGELFNLPFACSGCRGQKLGDEANNYTEANQMEFIDEFLRYNIEYLWIDAGWYEGRWPNGVGNWIIRKDGFPNGFRPITDYLKKLNIEFVLWFEPERVHNGTWIHQNHPDWLLRSKGSNHLLNLGNRDALNWLINHISGMITKEGISVYRQDFNIDPLAFWRKSDKKDRKGITEIRYIEGLYHLWDELRRIHPDLIIDNCASGGRRLDLETISRSVALWRTDYHYFEPNGYQCHTYGLNYFLPTTSTGNKYPDPYNFRSALENGIVLNWQVFEPNFSVDEANLRVKEFFEARPLFLGDYYPLTPYSTENNAIIGYQFVRNDLQKGMILLFRRQFSTQSSIRIFIRDLDKNRIYKLNFVDLNKWMTCSGEQLVNGLELEFSGVSNSILIFYEWSS